MENLSPPVKTDCNQNRFTTVFPQSLGKLLQGKFSQFSGKFLRRSFPQSLGKPCSYHVDSNRPDNNSGKPNPPFHYDGFPTFPQVLLLYLFLFKIQRIIQLWDKAQFYDAYDPARVDGLRERVEYLYNDTDYSIVTAGAVVCAISLFIIRSMGKRRNGRAWKNHPNKMNLTTYSHVFT